MNNEQGAMDNGGWKSGRDGEKGNGESWPSAQKSSAVGGREGRSNEEEGVSNEQ